MRTITSNCLPGSVKKRNLGLSSLLATLCFSIALFFSTASLAQTPAACNSGCTSNDVQIIGAYLSDASGNQLTNYVCGSGVPVFLTLRLTTNTPRVGVSIYSVIKTVVNGLPDDSVGVVSQCFGDALNTTGSIVTFSSPINWTPCGSQIALTSTYTAWGTGNKQFCASNTFQCGGTPSKCHSANADEITIIQVPQTNTASASQCSGVAGSYSYSFNLVGLESQIISNSSNYNFLFYNISSAPSSSSDTAGYRIATPTAFQVTAASTTVYAYVCDKAHPTACNWAPVTLTVYYTPTATGTSDSKCSSTGGQSSGAFDLTSYENTVKGSQSNVTVTWFSNAGLTTQITGSNLTSYSVTSSATVYAKVANTDHPTCYSNAAVNLTVYYTPTATGTSDSKCSSSASGTTATFNLTGYEGTIKGSQSGVTVSWFSNSGLTTSIGTPGSFNTGTTTVYAKVANTDHPTCYSSAAVNLTVNTTPDKPAFTISQPTLCGDATGSINICQTISGFDYIVGATTKHGDGNAYSFTGLAAGSNPSLEVVNTSGSCSSGTFTCSDASDCVSSERTIKTENVQSQLLTGNPTVKAYPNPFNDNVKFVVTSPESGQGSLDVYNMLGQKVKTIYQGHIAAGNNSFELSLPKKQQATLIYVFRIGDKKLTGKLLQLNN